MGASNCHCSVVVPPPPLAGEGKPGSTLAKFYEAAEGCAEDLRISNVDTFYVEQAATPTSPGSPTAGSATAGSAGSLEHVAGQAAPTSPGDVLIKGATEANQEIVKGVTIPQPGAQVEPDWESDSDAPDLKAEPKRFQRPRGFAVSSEPHCRGYYKEPFWNKYETHKKQLLNVLAGCAVFSQFTSDEIYKFLHAMEIHLRCAGELVAEEGEPGDSLLIVLEGTLECYRGGEKVAERNAGDVIDEHDILWCTPRTFTMKAKGECHFAKLLRIDYVNLNTRHHFQERLKWQEYLRSSKMLEMMDQENLAKIADCLKSRVFSAGTKIICQGDPGHEFFIMLSGEAKVTRRVGDDEQEHVRYHAGDLFGEVSLLKEQPRAASVTAVTKVQVLYISRKSFERLVGPMRSLQAQQYLTDPRKLIADFYRSGDAQGPAGSLNLAQREPDRGSESHWFSVYRPTSREAIAKMLSGIAVGKGLNVKGKSAKQGILSGFVPFVQISDVHDKDHLTESSPSWSRVQIFYRSKAARKDAVHKLTKFIKDMNTYLTDSTNRSIEHIDTYCSGQWGVWGLEIPEALLREAYIMQADISPVMGWETGRKSEPAYMDANLHALHDDKEPKVVLYQWDKNDAMNPRGVLVAYAEKYVKPVVSDFDTFLVGSKGVSYEPLPMEQASLVLWTLDRTNEILSKQEPRPWTTRWIEVLKYWNEVKKFHPDPPAYGFGDPTSYRLIGDVVKETEPCGAVRHGAECSNFYFPQELDDQYLVIWHGFERQGDINSKPWEYKSEEDLRRFLLDRANEGYAFPLNPVWPVRDPGWYDVLQALQQQPEAQRCLSAWFPLEMGILEKIEAIHREHPLGFVQKLLPQAADLDGSRSVKPTEAQN